VFGVSNKCQMAMVGVGGFMAHVGQLGPEVGSCPVLFCIHCLNQITLAMTVNHDDSTINIVLGIIIIIIIFLDPQYSVPEDIKKYR